MKNSVSRSTHTYRPNSSFVFNLEEMEQRRLNSVSYASSASTTDVSGNYFAALIYGDNGNVDGVPTVAAGVGDTTQSVQYTQWDSDPDDGIDNCDPTMIFALNTDSNHVASLTVAGVTGNTFSASPTTINSVTIRAGVTGPGLDFDWTSLQVIFYRQGTAVETVNLNALTANTLDASTWDPAESIATVKPTVTGVDGVEVAGIATIRANAGTYPGWTDIAGQIAVS